MTGFIWPWGLWIMSTRDNVCLAAASWIVGAAAIAGIMTAMGVPVGVGISPHCITGVEGIDCPPDVKFAGFFHTCVGFTSKVAMPPGGMAKPPGLSGIDNMEVVDKNFKASGFALALSILRAAWASMAS